MRNWGMDRSTQERYNRVMGANGSQPVTVTETNSFSLSASPLQPLEMRIDGVEVQPGSRIWLQQDEDGPFTEIGNAVSSMFSGRARNPFRTTSRVEAQVGNNYAIGSIGGSVVPGGSGRIIGTSQIPRIHVADAPVDPATRGHWVHTLLDQGRPMHVPEISRVEAPVDYSHILQQLQDPNFLYARVVSLKNSVPADTHKRDEHLALIEDCYQDCANKKGVWETYSTMLTPTFYNIGLFMLLWPRLNSHSYDANEYLTKPLQYLAELRTRAAWPFRQRDRASTRTVRLAREIIHSFERAAYRTNRAWIPPVIHGQANGEVVLEWHNWTTRMSVIVSPDNETLYDEIIFSEGSLEEPAIYRYACEHDYLDEIWRMFTPTSEFENSMILGWLPGGANGWLGRFGETSDTNRFWTSQSTGWERPSWFDTGAAPITTDTTALPLLHQTNPNDRLPFAGGDWRVQHSPVLTQYGINVTNTGF